MDEISVSMVRVAEEKMGAMRLERIRSRGRGRLPGPPPPCHRRHMALVDRESGCMGPDAALCAKETEAIPSQSPGRNHLS